MAISVTASLGAGLTNALRELSNGQDSTDRRRVEPVTALKRADEDVSSYAAVSRAPATVSELATRTDLAALQLSQLQALMLSLGQAKLDNFAKTGRHEAIPPAPASSTMDFYA